MLILILLILLIIRSLLAGLGSRRELMLENLVLRHQLQVALRTNPRPRLRQRDRVLWVGLRRMWPDGWREHLRMVRPETVVRPPQRLATVLDLEVQDYFPLKNDASETPQLTQNRS
jgi:hypothetical protein